MIKIDMAAHRKAEIPSGGEAILEPRKLPTIHSYSAGEVVGEPLKIEPPPLPRFRILSIRHSTACRLAWWRPLAIGYVDDVDLSGVFTEETACPDLVRNVKVTLEDASVLSQMPELAFKKLGITAEFLKRAQA